MTATGHSRMSLRLAVIVAVAAIVFGMVFARAIQLSGRSQPEDLRAKCAALCRWPRVVREFTFDVRPNGQAYTCRCAD